MQTLPAKESALP